MHWCVKRFEAELWFFCQPQNAPSAIKKKTKKKNPQKTGVQLQNPRIETPHAAEAGI